MLSLAPETFQPTFYSYLGGPGHDFVAGVAVDNPGNIFVAGQTASKKALPNEMLQAQPMGM